MFGVTDAVLVQVVASVGALCVAIVGVIGALVGVRNQKEPVKVALGEDPAAALEVEVRRLRQRCEDLQRQADAWKTLYEERARGE